MTDWIRVSERLPSGGEHVLVCTRYGDVLEETGYFRIKTATRDAAWVMRSGYHESPLYITHWQPLPEPPE